MSRIPSPRIEQEQSFRRLVQRHQECEERLSDLRALKWLSEEERVEEIRLKKLKLALKDEMAALERAGAGAP